MLRIARIAHGASFVVLQALPADGSCPHCEVSYASRLRAAAHVNDRRRGAACKAALLSGRYPRLSDEALAALRLEEAAARKEARATGHSQPLVAGSNRQRLRVLHHHLTCDGPLAPLGQ